jgi:outer membrane protein TolC
MKRRTWFILAIILAAAPVLADDMTWQQAVDEALVNNPALASARARLDQAKANSWQAFAGALPQVNGSASGSRSANEPGAGSVAYVNGLPEPAVNTRSDTYSMGLTARQLVFDFLKTLQNMEGASETEKAAGMNYIIASAGVRYNLMQAYAGLMKAQESVSITGTILKLRKQQMADIRQRYLAGREHKGSMMSVEADLKQAQFDSDQSARGLELAKSTFASALGRDKTDGLSLKADFTASTKPDQEPEFDKLFEKNPNLLMLIAQKNAAANAAGAAVSAFLPSVYVNGSVSRSDDVVPPQNTNWSVGVSVSMPILDGGMLTAQSLAADAALKAAEADLKSGRLSTMLELKNAWNGFKDAAGGLEVQKSSLDAYQERAKIADVQYTTGLITFDDWTIIQNGLVGAQKSYLEAQANLLVSEAAWIQAKGGTLEDEKVKPQ